MKKCKDCKWWGVDFEGVCDFPDTIQGGKSFDDGYGMEIKVSADDDQGLDARLHTGKNFGCINFKSDL